eukprot:CAMPEP_0204517080 /NCGR_PEP_ID=MMETSP0661-20131031/3481_1 /ASSEMBLY_ACC=CAM_ASM_000606 /TAXON_ID=109239 /ORGANISM="Alexandrium margalefi, Strain AMGDE01CS-322" /LENGTH=465 /DNA_ID=CAMNT_0051522465 /DNA_START=48 /DNA_END=1445 /DNA_ORIENTATION=-
MVNEEAEEYKKKGNDAFKDRNWDEAIKYYNKAVTLDPTNAAYYSNRSGAWSSKGNHESALSDANKCLGQDAQFVKGYARKGKALFDMDKWDEAEVAYKEGLQVDPTNDGCKRGIVDITSARQRRSSAGARSSGGGGGGGGLGAGMGGFLPKVLERFKKGGRMQSYLVMLVGYYLFTSLSGRFSKKTPATDAVDAPDAADYEYDKAGSDAPRPLGRQFSEVEGTWLSYLHAGRKSDSMLLLLHRSSLSAESEFGAVLPQLARAPPGGLQVLAPDRPCHGYSPCPEAGEPANASPWLNGFIAERAAPQRLALAAVGREAAGHALALARNRPEVVQVWLLAPSILSPDVNSSAGTPGLQAWLQQRQDSISPRAATDVLRWAAAGGSPLRTTEQAPEDIAVPKLPKRCKVTILYSDTDREDEQLASALQAQGVDPRVRNMGIGETVLDGLVDDVQQVLGDSGSSEADDE